MVAWTSVADVAGLLGPAAGAQFSADPMCELYVDASNDWCFRKRREAGRVDDAAADAPAPSQDVRLGAGLYAIHVWWERTSVDGFRSYEDLAGFQPTGGGLGRVRQLLGVGLAQVDAPADLVPVAAWRRRHILARWL